MRIKCWILASILVATCHGAALKPLGKPCPQGDGKYAVGCSQSYLECVNGIEYQRDCPVGLYFDIVLSRCETRSENNLCTEAQNENANVRQKALGIDCKNKKNGDYAIDRGTCDENYYQCSNGNGYMRKCPHKQYFISSTRRCDYYENCVSSSNEVKKHAASAHAFQPDENAVVESEEIVAPPNGINCDILANATISNLPCSPYFWQCASGSLFKKKCPSGLVYDLKGNICEYPEKKKGCKEYIEPEGRAAEVPDDSEAPVPPPIAPPARSSTTQPTHQPFVCNSTEDGFFALGFCEEVFISCFGGVSREIKCAENLVYDPRINACEYPLACKSERRHEDIPNLFNHGGIADKKNETAEAVSFNCAGKADGFYVEKPCINKYIQCNEEQVYAMKCPSDLVFNILHNVCDFVDNCKESADDTAKALNLVTSATPNPPTDATTVTTTTTSAVEQHDQTQTVTETPTTTATSTPTTTATVTSFPATGPVQTGETFSCADLVDGNYPSGTCKGVFYQCWNKYASATKCPASLIFNPYKGQCDYKENVADCREPSNLAALDNAPGFEPVESSATTTITPSPSTSMSTTTTTTQAATAREAAVAEVLEHSEPFCERLADGIYGVGCSPIFFKCNNFETTKQRCPEGLVFNIKAGFCDQAHNTEDCQKTIPALSVGEDTPSTTSTTPTAITDTPSNVEEEQPVDFSCAGRVDGIYALPQCSRKFVQCINGKSLVESCASGLFYSESTGLCDYKETVPNCSSKLARDAIDETICDEKANGYYVDGCSSKYYSCFEKKFREMVCPSNLKFSAKKGACDYPKDVEECLLKAGAVASPPEVSSDFCKTKTNGIFELKTCSPHYVVCENLVAMAGTCATPLIFNPTSELCDYKNNNPECNN